MSQYRDAIIAELERRVFARSGVLPFTLFTFPGYEVNWHHKLIAEALDRVANRKCKRLMIFMPPRSGKTELASRRFPAYVLGRNPNERVLSCSYNNDLATACSRDVQRVIRSEEYGRLFEPTRNALIARTRGHVASVGEFEIPGYRGSYKVAGVGGGITGRGFNIGIIDDPIKSREEAESKAYRDRVWEWYLSDFYTRRDKADSAIILIQTRWHHDDLAGRLLEQAANGGEKWEVISIPAVAEGGLAPGDPRQQGDPIWPARFSLRDLQDIRQALGAYNWSALYQQRPTPRKGGLFKVARVTLVDNLPLDLIARSIRYWDKAATEGGGCNSAGVLMCELKDRRLLVADCVAGQWSALEREVRIKQTALLDGRKVKIWVEQEPGSGGKESAENTVRMLSGWVCRADKVTGDKTTRAEPFAAQMEAGNVLVLNRPWTRAYLEELELFPAGKLRDRADASSGAFNKLFFKRITPHAGGHVHEGESLPSQATEGEWKDLLDAARTPEERRELVESLLANGLIDSARAEQLCPGVTTAQPETETEPHAPSDHSSTPSPA